MCNEWMKRNKLVMILIFIIVVVFLFKKSEKFDEKEIKFNINNLTTKDGKSDELKNYRLTNTQIINSNLDNALINNAKLNNVKIQGLTAEDVELTGNTTAKYLRVNGDLKVGDRIVFGENSLVISMPQSSSIILNDSNSRITIGTQTLTEETLKFLNELKDKSVAN